MGRPRLPEEKKMRSFTVGLSPRSTGRILLLLARATGRPGQEILRSIVVPALERMYAQETAKGRRLPALGFVEAMTEEKFRHYLTYGPDDDKPRPPAGARYRRRAPEPDHAA